MPETMQALVVLEPGRFEIREVPVPTPGPNEVLARVRAVSICGTDAHLIRGDYPGFWPPAFPFTPGHEWAGEIAPSAPGPERFGWKVGDRVAGHQPRRLRGLPRSASRAATTCARTTAGQGLHQQYGHSVQGADATYVVQGVKTIFPLPDALELRGRGAHRPGLDRPPRRQPRQRHARATRWRSPAPARSASSAGDAARIRGAGRVHRRRPRTAAGEGGRARLRDRQHRGRATRSAPSGR